MLLVKIVLENVTKKFGNTMAVDGLSLEIHDKEFVVLLGPSGCGKTTTLNMIAGLETVTAGSIFFDGAAVNDLSPERRDVAMVFQSYALYPHMTAFNNIAFPLRIRKKSSDEVRRRVDEVAEMLRIGRLLNKKPFELSGGERQRVALARAIIREPKAFLMDEPLSNIDAKLRVYMRAELIRLQKDLKITTVYVTHDQVEAMSMADRVAVMDRGRLMQVGEPLEVFERPATVFVGGFVGTPPMNLFDCTFIEKDNEGRLESTNISLELPPEVASLVKREATSPECILGVRPQDIRIYHERVPEAFHAEIYALEPLGTEVVVDLKIGDMIVKAVAPATFKARMADMMWFGIDKGRMHIFDKKTEKAIL